MMWWWVWCAAALCACVAAEDKRAEMSPLPFVLGSRYGRSPGPAGAPRMLAPRNDRFFMGSRYGKRSEGEGGPGGGAGAGAAGGGLASLRPLLCEFTGVAQLYRCERPQLLDSSRRGSDEGEED